MYNLVTSSGFTLIPPSGLMITIKSLQLDTADTSGNIVVSGSLGTINTAFTALTPIVVDQPFLMQENVTITPTSGLAIMNYVYAGSTHLGLFYQASTQYADASGVQIWPEVVQSGSFNYGSGKFGG